MVPLVFLAITADEVWAAWRPMRPSPQMDDDVELMAAAVQRRAVGPGGTRR